jgi:hypothetical protein
METIKIEDVKKGAAVGAAPIVTKKLTPNEEFLSECDEREAQIFEQVKKVLITQCDKYEFEAVTAENLEDFSMVISYIKNEVITLCEDGVEVKLRKPIKNDDGSIFAEKLKILYDRNEARERTFTAGIKVSKKSIESQKDFTLATLAASFANVNNAMISVETTRKIQKTNHRDYLLLLNIFNFFRN